MSDLHAPHTEDATLEASAASTSTNTPDSAKSGEKRNSTSGSSRSATSAKEQSAVPNGGGVVATEGEKGHDLSSQHDATNAQHQHDGSDAEKKEVIHTKDEGSSGANTTQGVTEVGDGKVEGTGNAEEEDINTVYPNGLQLGLLTMGLCFATFTVALDNTIIGRISSSALHSGITC